LSHGKSAGISFPKTTRLAGFEIGASRHPHCADPAHSGHPADSFRTLVRRVRKTVRQFAGLLSELNRQRVRIKSDRCPS
jgi:hypothetical protein